MDKKSVELLLSNYPYLEKMDITKNNSERDEVLYSLLQFFLSPDNEHFDLQQLYLHLDNEDLLLALQSIQLFYSKDTYLLRKDIEPMILQPEDNPLMNQKDFVEVLVENGIDFDRRKLNVYYNRGQLPSPALYISGKPYWYKSQILRYVRKKYKKDNSENYSY